MQLSELLESYRVVVTNEPSILIHLAEQYESRQFPTSML